MLRRMTEGDQIGGFTLLRRLGAGLGGETWLGEGKTGRYALKLVSIDEVARMDDLLREARILKHIQHENVVGYAGVIEVPGEAHAVLLTEYVEHGDLYDHIKRSGPVEPPQAAALCLQLVDALSVVHSKNILHRDLKPHNVLVTRRPEGLLLKVCDFGVSREVVTEHSRTTQAIVSPGYAAPEQYIRQQLTQAVDVYALGRVLWFLCTGRDPGRDPKPVGHEDTDAAIAAMTQMEPSARPSVQEARRMLSALADGAPLPDGGRTMMLQDLDSEESVVTRPSPTSTGEVRARRRRRFPIVGLLVLITAAAVFRATWGPLATDEAPPSEEPAVLEEPDEASDAVGFVSVVARPVAELSVDGEALGSAGVEPLRVELPVGDHVLELRHGEATTSLPVAVEAGKTLDLCWDFDAQSGC